jgi:catalase
MVEKKKIYTTGFGAPVDNDKNSKTAGNPSPILIQDTHLRLSHRDFGSC